jgi:hypothetical protein
VAGSRQPRPGVARHRAPIPCTTDGVEVNEFDPLVVWARDVRRITPQQVMLRAIVFVSPLIVLVAGDQASRSAPNTMFVVFVVLLAAGAAAIPDSNIALILMIVLFLYWSGAVDDTDTVWSLVAGLATLAFHTATAAASIGPARATIDQTTVGRWLLRATAVAGATVAVWLLVAAAVADESPANAAVVVLALLVVAAFGWLLHRRSTIS